MRVILRILSAAIVLASFGARAQKPKQELPPLALPTPSGQQPELALPLPSQQPPLDLGLFLKDTSLCVFPFLKESARGSADKAYLESIQKTFFDVAKDSPLLKDTVMLGENTKCELHDAACFSQVGKLARCQNVLVGSSAAKGNGYVLSVRMFEVGKQRVMPGSEVEQVLETDRQSDVQAWAEGQACRALQVKCVGRLYVDADRKDMNIFVDGRLAPRSFKTPEQIAVEPGVHAVRVAIGQRTSLEKKVAVRRGGFSDLIYARQTDKGGIPLALASELKGGPKPGPSAEFSEGNWRVAVGGTVAAVGVAVAGIGGYELLHGNSQISTADSAAKTRGGAYSTAEMSTLSSAHSAQRTGAALLIGGVVLAAVGVFLIAY